MSPALLPAPPPPAPAAPPPARAGALRRTGCAVGFAWLRSSLEASVYLRQAAVGHWTAPGPVRSFEEFEAAVGDGLAALGVAGGEAFVLLEQPELSHRTEAAPAFSARAARSYLAARVARQEENGGPLLWCAQPTATARQDSSFLLHLLPEAFFERMGRCFRAHGLRLSRIFPLAVPLALELLAKGGGSRLIAVETDGATTIAVAAEGRLAFARTLEASWSSEAARVAMEINRSLLYAKQQLGAVVLEVGLLGAPAAVAEVRERCGAGRAIVAGTPSPADWLGRLAALPARHPQNLLASRLQRDRRHGAVRAAAALACWVLLAAVAAVAWNGREAAQAGHRRYAALQRKAGALRAERVSLLGEDRRAAQSRLLLQAAADGAVAPVPLRTLVAVAGLLPAQVRLTDFQVEREAKPPVWSFHLGGTIEADEDTARSLVAALQDRLGREPLQARLADGARTLNPLPAPAGEPGLYSFTLGGTLP